MEGRVEVRPSAAERLTALVALVALAGAAVLALIGIVVHLIAVLVVFVGLLVCVTAGWYAVSRTGARRLIALAVALAALAGLITGLFFAGISVLRLTALVVLAALSLVAARYALRRTPRALRSQSVHLARAPAAQRPVLLMNPKSGGGKAQRFHLAAECEKRGIKPVLLRPGDDLVELATEAIEGGADAIGMAGGDGSQALVASIAAQRGIPYVCVPAGTRNHFALDLGLDRNDVVGALDAFADGVERRVDLGRVNGRVFVNNASLGLYAEVVQSPEYRDAKLKTAASMLPAYLGPEGATSDLQFSGPAGEPRSSAHLILVSNDPYQLIHPGGRGTRKRIDRGVLGIVAVSVADAAQARLFVTLQAAGQARRFDGWLEWAALRFEVASGGPVVIGVDGEALTMDPPLVFESCPGALCVRLPRHALKVSPAGRAVRLLSSSTVRELAQVAAGTPAQEEA